MKVDKATLDGMVLREDGVLAGPRGNFFHSDDFTPAERREIAEYMRERWAAWGGVADGTLYRQALVDVISNVPCGDFENGEDVDNNEGIADAVLSAFDVIPKAKGER